MSLDHQVRCLDVSRSIVAGGDNAFSILDLETLTVEKVEVKGRVDKVKCIGEGSQLLLIDGKVRAHKKAEKMYEVASDNVTDLSVHPDQEHCALAQADGNWSLFDCKRGQIVVEVDSKEAMRAIEFHPDGLLLATGHGNTEVKVWDIRT